MHGEHTAAPAAAYVPPAHSEHCLAFGIEPAGQDVVEQTVAPGALTFPVAHCWYDEAVLVPDVQDPAAQVLHTLDAAA